MVGLIRKTIVIMSIALLALVIVCSASAENVTVSGSAKDVKVSGSSTVMPLAEVAAEEFNALQRDYVVTISAGGTGSGILGIAERKNDIAMASREITDDEKERFG
ncbi:MAG TPA: substrate-binding domain-containing protein, partial [Methanothrix sp.]|nr:substrate-binding domain-containing protein [Methanothrix sp.]